MSDNNQNIINRLIESFKSASRNKKLTIIAMFASLLIGIIFLILGNTSNFFYSSICFVAFYMLLKNVK